MTDQEIEIKKLEYTAAQEMLCHYDSLNWQIGAILIAATFVLTGLALQEGVVASIKQSYYVTLGIPISSLFILTTWLKWFQRHRALYNLRFETLHRLEIQLGMYHHLRAAEADSRKSNEQIVKAKINAGYDNDGFQPIYPQDSLPSPSGYNLAKLLTFGIPLLQLILFLIIKYL